MLRAVLSRGTVSDALVQHDIVQIMLSIRCQRRARLQVIVVVLDNATSGRPAVGIGFLPCLPASTMLGRADDLQRRAKDWSIQRILS